MIRRLSFVLLVLSTTSSYGSGTLVAAYNETSQAFSGVYWPYSVGWLWAAPIDFELTRIETRFAEGPSKAVGIEVYDGLPHLGGVLLASATYNQASGAWGGADLGPISFVAGEDYLIGFTNVADLKANFTDDRGSTLFAVDGFIRYDTDGALPVSYVNNDLVNSNTIIRIYGNVPEPSSLFLGSLSVVATMRRRCHRVADANATYWRSATWKSRPR